MQMPFLNTLSGYLIVICGNSRTGKSIFENAKIAGQVYNARMEHNLITEYFEEVETTKE